MRFFINKLKQNEFAKSVAILSSGNVIAQAVNLLTIPIIARLYSENDYGEFAVLTAVTGVLLTVVSLGLNSAIMAPKDEKESEKTLIVNFYISIFASIVLMSVLIGISGWFKIVDIRLNYLIVCTYLLTIIIELSLVNMLTIYFNRKGNNKVLFHNSLVSAITNLVVTIPLGFIGFGIYGFLIAAIVTGIVRVIQMVRVESPLHTKVNREEFWRILKKNHKYIFFIYPSNFAGSYAMQMPINYLSRTYGNVQLGSYSMCDKLLGIPSRLLSSPISNVYFRTSTRYYNEGRDLAKLTFKFLMTIQMVAMYPPDQPTVANWIFSSIAAASLRC